MTSECVDLTLSDDERNAGHKDSGVNRPGGLLDTSPIQPTSRAQPFQGTAQTLSSGPDNRDYVPLGLVSSLPRTGLSGRCVAGDRYFDHLLNHWKEHHRPSAKCTYRKDHTSYSEQPTRTMTSNEKKPHARNTWTNPPSSVLMSHTDLPTRRSSASMSAGSADRDRDAKLGILPQPPIRRPPPQQRVQPTMQPSKLRSEGVSEGERATDRTSSVTAKSPDKSNYDTIRSSNGHASNDEPPMSKRRRLEHGDRYFVMGSGEEEKTSSAPAIPTVTERTPAQAAVPSPASFPHLSNTVARQSTSVATTSASDMGSTTRHGIPYNAEEDQLLYDLRQQGTSWSEIPQFFQGRTLGSLQVRYSTKLSGTTRKSSTVRPKEPRESSQRSSRSRLGYPDLSTNSDATTMPLSMSSIQKLKRRATGGAPRSRSNLRSQWSHDDESNDDEKAYSKDRRVDGIAQLTRLTRYRELGRSSVQGRCAQHDKLLTQNIAYESLATTKYVDDTSGDIATVAWSSDDRFFAGGGVVLMDESSMQYNRPRNLLIGDNMAVVRELPEHHIRRPDVAVGVNSLRSMRQTQDIRLFTTVQMVAFSPCDQHLYSVSTDGKLNSYDTSGRSASDVQFGSTFTHKGPIDLLTVGRHGLIATGCRSSASNSISIFKNDAESLKLQQSLSSRSSETRDISYASALKWGVAPHQSKWLLAGFGQEKERLYREDNDLDILGESCLFDGETGRRLELGIPRNVFDVAWNPNLGHTAFAVACVGFGRVNTGMHTVIRVYGEGTAGLRCTVELECPARDINDLIFCPYDENLVAAGSADGKVYVWDIRSTRTSQDPQMALSHGNCISVLPHDRKRWEVDTGVRFLSWGANHTRLFSGSSDGVVKVWDPYVNNDDTHIRDVATFKSAIMSGAFNSDHTQLLIGEDQSRLSLLEVGASDLAGPERFSLLSAPDPAASEPAPHKALLESGEVVFEHCGALPIRQAVQGPNYKPPKDLLTPSEAELHHRALRLQRDLFHQRNRWKRVKRAATEEGGKIHPCTLDCGYTPRVDGDGDDVPDSGRAADRIPEALRSEPEKGMAALVKGKVAKCSTCGAPARPREQAGSAVVNFCERCAFACFRCGETALLSAAGETVVCNLCGIKWQADVLGYEVLNQGPTGKARPEKEEMEGEDLADAELEHYLDCIA